MVSDMAEVVSVPDAPLPPDTHSLEDRHTESKHIMELENARG